MENQKKQDRTNENAEKLRKLKRRDLLEIMLAQSREIDRLREQVDALQAQLDDRNLKLEKAGSLAEASLAVTKVFDEAQKAADLYLENVRRLPPEAAQKAAAERKAEAERKAAAEKTEEPAAPEKPASADRIPVQTAAGTVRPEKTEAPDPDRIEVHVGARKEPEKDDPVRSAVGAVLNGLRSIRRPGAKKSGGSRAGDGKHDGKH